MKYFKLLASYVAQRNSEDHLWVVLHMNSFYNELSFS